MVGTMPNRLRVVVIVAGLILFIIGAIIVIFPNIAILISVYLIAFGLIISGLERIITGILG